MVTTKQKDFSQMSEIKGLKELQAELRRANPAVAKRLQEVNKKLVESVAAEARTRIYPAHTARHGKSGHTKVAASIRGTASGTRAQVVAGGPKAPTFFGVEFGGGAKPSTRQFPAWKGTGQSAGYFLYPVVRDRKKTAEKDWNDIFDDVFSNRGGPI